MSTQSGVSWNVGEPITQAHVDQVYRALQLLRENGIVRFDVPKA